MVVSEVFFSLEVGDMARATAFYVSNFEARVSAATPFWTSIHIAGVRIGLFLNAHEPTRTALHFSVPALEDAIAAVVKSGGAVVTPPTEVAPGVVTAEVADTEGNILTLVRG